MKVKYSLVCDYANRDITGKVMMIGAFDSINTTAVPCLHPSFYFVVGIEALPAENGDYQFSIRLYENETKEEITSINDRFSMSLNKKGVHTIVLGFVGTVFPREGEYTLDLLINDTNFVSESITINLAPN